MSKAIEYRRPPQLDGVELLCLSDPDFNFAPHIHDTYVFWLNSHGGECVHLGGSSDILQPDSFGVVAPGEVHANHAVTKHRTLESLYIAQTAIDDIGAQLELRTTEFHSRLQRDSQARRALARLHTELMVETDPFRIRETFLRVFSFLVERHGDGRSANRLTKADPVKVQTAKEIMQDRFTEPLGLDELAVLCDCSACHLIRLFRRETGLTPHAWLMELRLAHAQSRLSSAASLADIAQGCGFTDQSHFTRRFRLRFGLTPGRYRCQVC